MNFIYIGFFCFVAEFMTWIKFWESQRYIKTDAQSNIINGKPNLNWTFTCKKFAFSEKIQTEGMEKSSQNKNNWIFIWLINNFIQFNQQMWSIPYKLKG